MKTTNTFVAFLLVAGILSACQQNPFPEDGLLRKEPLSKPLVQREEWPKEKMLCVELGDVVEIPVTISNTEPMDTTVESTILPEEARTEVSFDVNRIRIIARKIGLKHFILSSTANRELFPSSTTEESFAYTVSKKCEEVAK